MKVSTDAPSLLLTQFSEPMERDSFLGGQIMTSIDARSLLEDKARESMAPWWAAGAASEVLAKNAMVTRALKTFMIVVWFMLLDGTKLDDFAKRKVNLNLRFGLVW
jgi:hypothetical protein